MNISLQMASREQKKADESVLRLVEEHKVFFISTQFKLYNKLIPKSKEKKPSLICVLILNFFPS